MKFSAVKQELFNQLMEQVISGLDRLPPTREVSNKN
jgi:hypothetical protein